MEHYQDPLYFHSVIPQNVRGYCNYVMVYNLKYQVFFNFITSLVCNPES